MTPSSVVIANASFLESRKGSSSPFMQISGLPGVRTEERSPGSYRIAVRGSTIRSPFGIRNIKVYLNEFPLTDAGGNTYLNLIDFNLVNRAEILKGPDGSLFGANSGGVLKIVTDPDPGDSISFKVRLSGGSFETYNESLQTTFKLSNHLLSIGQSIHSTKGYRDHSAFGRVNLILSDRWSYNVRSSLKSFFTYSRLKYQTPGGLTFEQWEQDPKSARPPTSMLPGAEEQDANVSNSSFYGGILHESRINQLYHSILVFGSFTDFTNKFITNIETHSENNIGFRTLLESGHSINNFAIRFIIGSEFQKSINKIKNFGNKSGTIDTIQSRDDLKAIQTIIFGRTSLIYKNRLITEISTGINFNKYEILNFNTSTPEIKNHNFEPHLLPKLEISYLIKRNVSVRISTGRGYSLPSFAEIRPSGNILNTSLMPEQGYNYETGIRMSSKNYRIWIDLSFYQYRLKNAIVRSTNEDGVESFSNTGSIKQLGLESLVDFKLIQYTSSKIIQSASIIISSTNCNYNFQDYIKDSINLDGNRVTGVPNFTLSIEFLAKFKNKLSFVSRYNYQSSVPLNDANSDYSDVASLLFLKAGLDLNIKDHFLACYLAIDNLLNTKYSLGYDFNAFAGRYFNSAPLRTLQIGFTFNF